MEKKRISPYPRRYFSLKRERKRMSILQSRLSDTARRGKKKGGGKDRGRKGFLERDS